MNLKCEKCSEDLVIGWKTYKDGTKHIHARCMTCGITTKLKQTPNNMSLASGDISISDISNEQDRLVEFLSQLVYDVPLEKIEHAAQWVGIDLPIKDLCIKQYAVDLAGKLR